MIRRIAIAVGILWIVFGTIACVSGGKFAKQDNSRDFLVDYDAKGTYPPNVSWHLIRSEKGLAILEKNLDGTAADAIIHEAWKDSQGRHFVFWAQVMGAQSTAFEFIVPEDLTQTAFRYAYPAGSYAILEIDGSQRPVPVKKKGAPATRLVPVKQD